MALALDGKVVLYFSSVDISLANGPGVNEREFVRCLQATFGKRCLCVVPRPRGRVAEHVGAGIRYCMSHAGYAPARYVLFSIQQAVIVLWLLWRHDVGLVVTRLGPLSIAAWLVTHLTRTPLAAKTVGRFWRDPPRRLSVSALSGRLTQWLNVGVLCRAVAIDTVTSQFRERIVAATRHPQRVLQIDNAVNVQAFRPMAEEELAGSNPVADLWPVLGYVGGFPSRRGAKELVEAAAALRERYPRIGVLIVGEDDGMPAIRRLAAERGVSDVCRFVGEVSYDEVPRYINRMDVGVAFDRVERALRIGNSSQKVRQYLACGVPVVALEVGNEFLSERGLGARVDPRNHAQVRDALVHWVEIQRTDPEFASRARRYAIDNLSNEQAMQRRQAFWSAMLERRYDDNGRGVAPGQRA